MTTKRVTKKAVQKKAPTTKKATANKTAKPKDPPKKTVQKKTIPKKTTTQKTTKTTAKPKTTTTDKHTIFYACDNLTKTFRVAENARPVTFKGFEGFDFFMHKSLADKGWTISEASSGASIVTKPTQANAKARAVEILKQHGHDGLHECVQKAIEKTGTAPGFKAPPKGVMIDKQNFSLTTKDGTKVEVTYQPDNRHHLEFRGEISSTGYRSHFGYDGKSDVKEFAAKYAEELRSNYLKEKAKLARSNKVHIVKPAPATKPTEKPSAEPSGKGGKPTQCLGSQNRDHTRPVNEGITSAAKRGKACRGSRLSMLDAAAEILKTAKEPLCCKDICRAIFEKKLAESSGRTPHATISAAMGREINTQGKNSRFRKAGRGMFEFNK